LADITSDDKPKKKFSDSWVSLALMIAFIVLLRTLLLEPFKIPSGSMEPTLIGHEDFGDRILTNKLAYISTIEAIFAAVLFVVLILQGMIWSMDFDANGKVTDEKPVYAVIVLVVLRVLKGFRSLTWYNSLHLDWVALGILALLAVHTVYWIVRNVSLFRTHFRPVRTAIIFLVLILGGMSWAWMNNAVAAEPKRFDVVVFDYNSYWNFNRNEKHDETGQDINYIKRLTGLPGDKIMVSGGDLFLYDRKSE
jgi:signal peptidase I